MFVRMSDHSSWTPEPIYLKFLLGTWETHGNVFAWFEILSSLSGPTLEGKNRQNRNLRQGFGKRWK